MNAYYEEKSDFKKNGSAKSWKFLKTVIQTKKSASNGTILAFKTDAGVITKESEVGTSLNKHFTNFVSPNIVTKEESYRFINNIFKDLKRNKTISPKTFAFTKISVIDVSEAIDHLDSASSDGISNKPVKLLKHCSAELVNILTKLFNNCLSTGTMPKEWKTAIVSPLYTGKDPDDCVDSYRGISILTPINKAFERILSKQILNYFESNMLLSINTFKKNIMDVITTRTKSGEHSLSFFLVSVMNMVIKDSFLLGIALYKKFISTIFSNLFDSFNQLFKNDFIFSFYFLFSNIFCRLARISGL
jgi:hypothetical protein